MKYSDKIIALGQRFDDPAVDILVQIEIDTHKLMRVHNLLKDNFLTFSFDDLQNISKNTDVLGSDMQLFNWENDLVPTEKNRIEQLKAIQHLLKNDLDKILAIIKG